MLENVSYQRHHQRRNSPSKPSIKSLAIELPTKKLTAAILGISASAVLVLTTPNAHAEEKAEENAASITDALTSGKGFGSFRLRYEGVDDDAAADDANALTLRTLVGYKTGSFNGFSGVVSAEDVRIVAGEGDYSVPPTGYQTGEYAVIADPETTELHEAYVQYSSEMFSARLGRQAINLNNQRFVGAVAWRQDFQTFDALQLAYRPIKDLSLSFTQIDQRNRIFAEAQDIDSSDQLYDVSYKTPIGTVAGYYYSLEADTADDSLDTVGAFLAGNKKFGEFPLLYRAELATQELGDAEADYAHFFAGTKVGMVNFGLGYELLGSDDGGYGFATPLATLHKFNGWADKFLVTPAEGLQDFYLSVGTKVSGFTLKAVYHNFTSDEENAVGEDDLGSEINLLAVKKFGRYTVGAKYANYSEGDFSPREDTQKIWLWTQVAF